MRNLILLVIGIGLGTLGTATVLNTLNRRDAYPRGVMAVMQHHYSSLRDAVRTGRCDDPSVTGHAARLGLLAGEIESSIYGSATADPPFREYLQRLRDALAQLAAAPGGCPDLAPIVVKAGNACDECHRQYR